MDKLLIHIVTEQLDEFFMVAELSIDLFYKSEAFSEAIFCLLQGTMMDAAGIDLLVFLGGHLECSDEKLGHVQDSVNEDLGKLWKVSHE